MNIGGRDYIGAASYLSGIAKGSAAKQADETAQAPSPLTPEMVLEELDQLKMADLRMLAEDFGVDPETVLPNVEKLVELGFVSQKDDSETYALTDLGHRARKYAQIAESSSLR